MVCIIQNPLLDSFYILKKNPGTSFNNLILACKDEKYFLIKHSQMVYYLYVSLRQLEDSVSTLSFSAFCLVFQFIDNY